MLVMGPLASSMVTSSDTEHPRGKECGPGQWLRRCENPSQASLGRSHQEFQERPTLSDKKGEGEEEEKSNDGEEEVCS